MPKALPITEAHCKRFHELWNEHQDKTRDVIGRMFRKEHPEVFAKASKDLSIYSRMLIECRQQGMDLERRLTGPKVMPKANRDWAKAAPELILPALDHVLVIPDSHFPYHSEETFDRVRQLLQAFKFDLVFWGGDFLDNAYKGHKGRRDHIAPRFVEGLHTHAEMVNLIDEWSGGADQLFIPGNHDDKPQRDTDLETPFSDWIFSKWFPLNHAPLVTVPRERLRITDRYYALMRPRVAPGEFRKSPLEFPTMICHQQNYSKIPGRVGQSLANVYLTNVVTTHQHHLSISFHESNKMWAADAGMGQDSDLPRYKNERPSNHRRWNQGFLSIHYGYPKIWYGEAPDEWWKGELRGMKARSDKAAA